MTVRVKICGLRSAADVTSAVEAGAAFLGFNFFPKSPRSVSPDEARELALDVPAGVAKVGLVVDADDRLLDELLTVVPLDIVQLHGQETPARVTEIRARTGLPVMKALGIAGTEDLPKIETYGAVADMLLIDAKPAPGAMLPGGNGVPFDWRLIAGRDWPCPWMLAGGLTPGNVAEAMRLTGAPVADVSSGVEAAPGMKDASLVADFIRAARGAGR